MRKQHGHRWTLAATALALTLALSACGGGETPDQLSVSLADASTTLPYADVTDTDCVANAIMDEVGFEQLQIEEVTTESLTLDPESVADLLENHQSDDLDEAIENCVETDILFRNALAPMSPGGVTCDDPFTRDTELVAEFVTAHLESVDAELTIEDTPEMRDLFRPCLAEEDFAELFGLDTRAELASALNDELDSRIDGTLTTNCGGKSIVAEFGVERLAELGLTTETPNLNLTRMDLSTETRNALLEAVAECVSYKDVLRAEVLQDYPMLADCVGEELSGGYEEDRVWFNLGERSREVVLERMIGRAGGECLESHIDSVFGEFNLLKMQSVNAFAALFTLEDDDLASSRGSMRCAAYGAYLDRGQETIDADLELILGGSEDDPAAWQALDAVLKALLENKRECMGDWLFLTDNFYRAGFREGTLDCVMDRFDGQTEAMATLYVRYITAPDITWTEVNQMETFFEDLLETTELCMDPGEQRTYDKLQNWIDNFEAGVEAQDGAASV